ncbi:MAG: RNA-directed DNA polymerase [Clostridium paraputrificum]
MISIDKLTILKNDTVPYETPLIYTNNRLSDFLRNDTSWKQIGKESLDSITSTRAYCFKVYKNDMEDRELYLCHPLGQMYMLKFLEIYDQSIIDYFKLNSGFSLRMPCEINSSYLKEKKYVETQFEKIFEKELETSSNEYYDYIDSYFIKKPFIKITDFYSSFKLKNYEAKYKYLRKIDVSKCFYNIYTHSIEWAFLGNKEEAKNTLSKGIKIGAVLDKVMQYCNYAETNGIVVGPEFSRIVAEIILCRIDMKVKMILNDRNYDIVRFMDDIFIFSNSKDDLDYIQGVYKDELFEFNLSINKDKVSTYMSPFFDEQTWIINTKNILRMYKKSFEISEEDREKEEWILKRKLKRKDKKVFETLRILLINNRSQISYIISYVMTYIDRNLNDIITLIDSCRESIKEHNIVRLIDFISYFVSFNLSSNNTLKLCKIFITLLTKYKDEFKGIEDFIFKKSFELIKYNKRKFVDIQNLIIMLKFIEKDLPEEMLLSWLKEESEYFSLVVISFYVSSKSRKYRYKKTKNIINNIILNKVNRHIEKERSGVSIQQLLYDFDIILFNDFYNCPVMNEVVKNAISNIKTSIVGITPKGNIQKCYFNFIKGFNNSFINWESSIEELTTNILKKSRYVNSNPY